jgi:hypothetical protein
MPVEIDLDLPKRIPEKLKTIRELRLWARSHPASIALKPEHEERLRKLGVKI